MKAVVVGGGIAGLCCAYSLRKRDVEVTLVDRARIGARTASSWGNGGWIAPAQAGPLPEPGLTVYGLRALLRADSALFFRPTYLPRLAPWLARFWTYCNQRDYDRGTAALAALGKSSFELTDRMAEDGVSFDVWKLGMVCATAKPEDARKVLRSLEGMRAHGYELPTDILGEDEIHELEPALNDRVKAGFHLREQWHVKADTLVNGLGAKLREMGVEVLEGAEVVQLDRADSRVRSIRTGAGELTADHFVLAAGSWTAKLTEKVGIPIPMEPGKGYSFLLEPKVMPRHGILFADIHAGLTPLGDRVRIGGTMEFSGYDLAIDQRRIDSLFEHARGYVELDAPSYEEPWAGLRPMTVDGLPIIDRARPLTNVSVATGYSMLGMTISAPAAEALAEMIVTGERPALLEPFRIDRFPRWLVRRPGRG
ncbi:MAG TPA: FAD-dependent oxidoreductase [Gaiella sp.]|nr:FAD-dependent oxidoreductase [Gaiella sp.]